MLAKVPARFAEREFSPSNLELLRTDMHRALVAEGLFADEADAMLDTWQEAYFHSPGLRLFFTVPQEWTGLLAAARIFRPSRADPHHGGSHRGGHSKTTGPAGGDCRTSGRVLSHGSIGPPCSKKMGAENSGKARFSSRSKKAA